MNTRKPRLLDGLPRYDDCATPEHDPGYTELDPKSPEALEAEALDLAESAPSCFRCGSPNVDVEQDGSLSVTKCRDCQAEKHRVE